MALWNVEKSTSPQFLKSKNLNDLKRKVSSFYYAVHFYESFVFRDCSNLNFLGDIDSYILRLESIVDRIKAG